MRNAFGAVAQLGERELCKLEVVGSITIGSTIGMRQSRASCSGGKIRIQTRFVAHAARQVCCSLDIVKAGLTGLSLGLDPVDCAHRLI